MVSGVFLPRRWRLAVEGSIDKVVILQASNAIVDAAAIDRKLVPDYFDRYFKKSLADNRLRLPTDQEIYNKPHLIKREPNLMFDHLIRLQAPGQDAFSYRMEDIIAFELECASDDAAVGEFFSDFNDRYVDSWLKEANSGNYIREDICSVLQSLKNAGFCIRLLDDITDSNFSCYQKLSDARIVTERDIRAVDNAFGWENAVPVKFFPDLLRTPMSRVVVFCNNSAFLANCYNMGIAIAACSYFPDQPVSSLMLPHSVPKDKISIVKQPDEIQGIVNLLAPDYSAEINLPDLPKIEGPQV